MAASTPVIRNYISSSNGSEAADTLDLSDEEGWEDVEPEQAREKIISLLDHSVFSDVLSMLNYCNEKYGFDFLSIRQEYGLDFYGCIKLVNYIRAEVKNGRQVSSDISREDFDKEDFLKPVLADDSLLFSLDDLPAVTSVGSFGLDGTTSLRARVAELEEELQRSQSELSEYRKFVNQTLNERWKETLPYGYPAKDVSKTQDRDDDAHYFSSYSYNDIHETMLKDAVRTDAYRDFIYKYKNLLVDKIVLDVGCGTGILSLFCAKAGAARVIAVDNSDIIDKARENVYNNGLSDKIICLRGKIEDVTLPVDKVDIIVSEWMGYCLLYEAMLDSVIWARDKYLVENGLMIPSHMNMWVAPISDPDYIMDHIAFWRDVYGFDMKAMQTGIYDDSQVLNMPKNSLCGNSFPFLQLDLHSTDVKDLMFKRTWNCVLNKDIDRLDGFIIWFDAFFMPSRADKIPKDSKAEDWQRTEEKGVAFTTGPFGRETHWRQGVFFVDSKINSPGHKAGDKLVGEVEYAVPRENSRALDIKLSWGEDYRSTLRSQSWKMR